MPELLRCPYQLIAEQIDNYVAENPNLTTDGGGAKDPRLKPEYKDILTQFSNRFVFASDYGDGRAPLAYYLNHKVQNFNKIIRDLPKEAKHNIAYKNAWYLLTGRNWNNK